MLKIIIAVAIFCSAVFLSPAPAAAEISHKEFLSSDFIKSFKNHEYEKALKECNVLLKKYPNDPLISRYRALTLEKLHRSPEAINLYHEILAAYPRDIPARLFLGLAYIKEGANEKAAAELRYVVKHGVLPEYRHWAQEQLNRLYSHKISGGKRITKKPYIIGKTGILYDSNPLLLPDDKTLSSKKENRPRFICLNSTRDILCS